MGDFVNTASFNQASKHGILEISAGEKLISAHGVLLIAHGRQEYLQEAIALARSIKLSNPSIAVALSTDLQFDFAVLRNCVDIVVRFDFKKYSGVSSKLCMDFLSPFEGNTLFVDTDCLAFADIGEFLSRPIVGFEAYGTEYKTIHHWFKPNSSARALAKAERVACFVGGCYRFDRSLGARKCFEMAREYFENYEELGFLPIKGGVRNEEPLFSIAMSNSGFSCIPESGAPVKNLTPGDMPRVGYTRASTIAKNEYLPKQPILHFHSFKRTLKYECLRREMLGGAEDSASLRFFGAGIRVVKRKLIELGRRASSRKSMS